MVFLAWLPQKIFKRPQEKKKKFNYLQILVKSTGISLLKTITRKAFIISVTHYLISQMIV